MRLQQATTPPRLNAVGEKRQCLLQQPDGRMLLQVAECLRIDFMRRLSAAVKRQLVLFDKVAAIHSVTLPKAGEGSPAASAESDDGAAPGRRTSNKEDEDENEEENEENNEGKLRFAGACLSVRRLCLCAFVCKAL